jgi:subtilisin family serine protease
MNFKISLIFFLFPFFVPAQKVNKKVLNWYNNGGFGMNTQMAYSKVLNSKKTNPVIVAIIDSGVDTDHEDLEKNIWVNEDEIPGNNIDDDKNGYIDDVNGWNFLGNANGENINDVRLEVTRIYAHLRLKYDSILEDDYNIMDSMEYNLYLEVKDKVESKINSGKKQAESFSAIIDLYGGYDEQLKEYFNGEYTLKQLKKIKKKSELFESASAMKGIYSSGLSFSSLKSMVKYSTDQLEYNYNPDINPRAEVIGDNLSDINDKFYGNNDVEGPDASHGTHCAGIVGAVRNNGIGNDGVANNVKLMSVRAVPNGDEWDKDIALAIRYAVDNGAKVVNMSFGKSYSPNKELVIEAIRYSEDKGVLLVHAAGNSSLNNDTTSHFPTPRYSSMSESFSNWIEVGASTRFKKAKVKKEYLVRDGLAAEFSNYGKEYVDVFAPGHDIYSTVPSSEYDTFNGTSMAAPMVAGVAALLKSYYPSLSMIEIRDIIFQSVTDHKEHLTLLPGSNEIEVAFGDLSVTGGVVNVYNAVLLAEKKVK